MMPRTRVEDLAVVSGQPHDLERVADRRQGVAQLVRQEGQELVLVAVGLLERLLGATSWRSRRGRRARRRRPCPHSSRIGAALSSIGYSSPDLETRTKLSSGPTTVPARITRVAG